MKANKNSGSRTKKIRIERKKLSSHEFFTDVIHFHIIEQHLLNGTGFTAEKKNAKHGKKVKRQ